ncbi:MAG: DUF4249 family protein [Chitinophagaceae bacterium]
MKAFKLLAFVPFLCLFASCEKVIEVNVKNSQPTIVIVGEITDWSGPYTVQLSRSVQLEDTIANPPVSALVYVTELGGLTDTFRAIGNGIYQSKFLQGKVGNTYILHVVADGKEYISSSTMPAIVTFQSLTIVGQAFFKDSSFYPQVQYLDPANVSNYYRFVEYKNDSLVKASFSRSDKFSDGKLNQVLLRNGDYKVNKGDKVMVDMQCLDEGAYNYFSTLGNANGSSNSAAPADPNSNISGGALGYFSAHTSAIRAVVR